MASEAGPASTAAASEPAASDIGGPPFYFAVLGAAALVGAAHEVFVVQPALYVDAENAAFRPLIGVTGLGAAAFGIFAARQRWADAFGALPWMLAFASLSVGTSAGVAYFAFATGAPLVATSLGTALVTGAALGASTALGLGALGRTLVRLDAPWRLANPFRLLALAVLCGTGAGIASVVGPLRASLSLAMLLAALGAWAPTLRWFLERRSVRGAAVARLASFSAVLLWLGLFFACELVVPTAILGSHPNPVVFHRESERGRYEVTSGQEGYELWVDGHLKVSTLDERRYFEALVHPALGVARARGRVLLLGGGAGPAEREILRHPDVESLTVVVVDRTLVDVARTQTWLARRAEGALTSPRLRVIEREPILWLAEGSERFDVAVVDLPDPEGHVEGKNFTRYFYRKLRERLTPDGVCVVQALSPFTAPTSFDSIVATLRAAELEPRPYHAAVPSLGDWGFVLGFVRAPGEVDFATARAWLSGTTVDELSYMPKDLRAKRPGRPATLSDQSVVEELGREMPH